MFAGGGTAPERRAVAERHLFSCVQQGYLILSLLVTFSMLGLADYPVQPSIWMVAKLVNYV